MLDQSAKAEGTERVTLAAARLTLARANPNGEHDAHRLEAKPEPARGEAGEPSAQTLGASGEREICVR